MYVYMYICIGGWGVDPTRKSDSFRSFVRACVRACEAVRAREAMCFPKLGWFEMRCAAPRDSSRAFPSEFANRNQGFGDEMGAGQNFKPAGKPARPAQPGRPAQPSINTS